MLPFALHRCHRYSSLFSIVIILIFLKTAGRPKGDMMSCDHIFLHDFSKWQAGHSSDKLSVPHANPGALIPKLLVGIIPNPREIARFAVRLRIRSGRFRKFYEHKNKRHGRAGEFLILSCLFLTVSEVLPSAALRPPVPVSDHRHRRVPHSAWLLGSPASAVLPPGIPGKPIFCRRGAPRIPPGVRGSSGAWSFRPRQRLPSLSCEA